MTIGIPRALFYWKNPFLEGSPQSDFWKHFFENLGLEVLVSPETNKKIVEKGLKISDPEACFSTKVLWGHILWLDGKENIDYIFVPRLKTDEKKLEYCPKFFGIPELAKIIAKNKILTETFDARIYSPPKNLPLSSTHKEQEFSPYFQAALQKLGGKLGFNNQEIKKATRLALQKEKEFKEKQDQNFLKKIRSEKPKIVLVSHPYNLYDDYVNVGIKSKLEKLGIETIFVDEVPSSQQAVSSKRADYPDFHWEFGKEIMQKIQTILNYPVSGAIQISSFLCGCDAVLKEFVEKKFKQNKIPFLYLIIDEHTADAGVQTRIEAFLDTLQ
jgi:predicted nucleotide-binding protein (sugar kinase/HSP70/actin superfamily)